MPSSKRFGAPGIAALERIRAAIPAAIPVVADAKRGDIGSTARFQAVALFDVLGADAITASPYVGEEGLGPFLERGDRYAYILCRTSNPGSDELQGLVVEGLPAAGLPAEPVYERVARRVATWGPGGTVGLVVGATAPLEMGRIRAIAPGLGFLVPGVGAQGGAVGPVLAHGPAVSSPAGGRPGSRPPGQRVAGDRPGGSRGAPDGPADPGERIAAAARNWSTTLAVPVLS